jgi:hypothetical protein
MPQKSRATGTSSAKRPLTGMGKLQVFCFRCKRTAQVLSQKAFNDSWASSVSSLQTGLMVPHQVVV